MSDDRLLRVSMNAAEEKVEPIRKTRIVSTYRNDVDGDEPVPLKSKKPRDRRREFCVLGTVGIILAISGFLSGFFLRYTIEDTVEKSMRVCDENASTYKNWLQNFEGSPNETHIDEDSETTIPLYKYFYVFNMTNPTEYLNGEEAAELVENGPYVLREYISFLNVSFEGDNNVSYDEWHYYVPQDGMQNTTNMFCEGCTRNDLVTNLNVAYLRLLGQGQNEGSVLLASKCTQGQILNIQSALAGNLPFCNTSQAGDMSQDAACGCCNPYPSVVPSPDGRLECRSITDIKGSMVGLFSLLAFYDGGVRVSSESSAFTGSGLYSPLVMKKSVKELALGYPNALAGYMLAKITITQTETLYPGNETMIRLALRNQAEYTNQVRDMCAANCTMVTDLGKLGNLIMEGRMEDVVQCETRLPNFIDDVKYRFLDGVHCRPYSFTMLTKLVCNPFLGGSNCKCADGSDPIQDGPCCLSDGYNSLFKLSLAGMGCLFEVPGIIDDRQFATPEQRQDYYAKQGKSKRSTQITGCGAEENAKEHVGWAKVSDSKTETDIWQFNQTDRAFDVLPPSPGRLTAFVKNPETRSTILGGETYTAKTMGSLGQRFPGTSVTADLFSWHISTGKPYNESYHIFLKQARRPVDVYFHSTEDIKGIKTDRFLTEKDFLNREYGDNIKTGTGVPFDGVECLTYVYEAPVFVHRPNFLYGDEFLLNQSVVPDRFEYEAKNRSVGIRMYRGYENYAPNAKKIVGPLPQIDTQTLRDFMDEYDTIMHIEPASGVTVKAHGRLGASFSVFSCDPKDPLSSSCLLFPNKNSKCYGKTASASPFLQNTSLPCSSANILTPNILGDVLIPQYWVDQTSEVNDYVASKLRMSGQLHLLGGVLMVCLAALGVILALTGLILFGREMKRFQDEAMCEENDVYVPLDGGKEEKVDNDKGARPVSSVKSTIPL